MADGGREDQGIAVEITDAEQRIRAAVPIAAVYPEADLRGVSATPTANSSVRVAGSAGETPWRA